MTAREGLKLAAASFITGAVVGLVGFAVYLAVAAVGEHRGWFRW